MKRTAHVPKDYVILSNMQTLHRVSFKSWIPAFGGLALLAAACKPPAETSATAPPPDSAVAAAPAPAPDTPAAEPAPNAVRYRLIVMFISIGEGTDLLAGSKLMNFLGEYKQRTGIEINYTAVPWGREGEVDFCFPLGELDEEKQAAFVQEVRDTLDYSHLVQFAENETCSHLR
jgi:hypothetical protein